MIQKKHVILILMLHLKLQLPLQIAKSCGIYQGCAVSLSLVWASLVGVGAGVGSCKNRDSGSDSRQILKIIRNFL